MPISDQMHLAPSLRFLIITDFILRVIKLKPPSSSTAAQDNISLRIEIDREARFPSSVFDVLHVRNTR